MKVDSTFRVMWLLNHTSARKFEIPQLEALGLECFTPKSFPCDEANLSASVDYSQDACLSIPKDSLDVLNAQDWYQSPDNEAWEIANQYFDIAVVGFIPNQLSQVLRHFKGSVILRAFGLKSNDSYTQMMYNQIGPNLVREIKAAGKRFWFGSAYEHLHEIEAELIAKRNCFLPIASGHRSETDNWTGIEAKILFICPRIGTSPYYNKIYQNFKNNFENIPHTIGGAQPIEVDDSNVIGFVSRQEHDRNICEHRVMFYHSQEPYHIHYHPFEAVAAGMPLVFMAGGMLDTLGGKDLPGRCKSIGEAKKKTGKILKNNKRFINKIIKTQRILLEKVSTKHCAPIYQENFHQIINELKNRRAIGRTKADSRKKIAVILPRPYLGGSLRGAIMIAEAIWRGSAQANEEVEVEFLHLDDKDLYSDDDFSDLPLVVNRRGFHLKELNSEQAVQAMRYAGYRQWQPQSGLYTIFDDGIKQLQEFDLWLVVSDRMTSPILPLKPTVHMIYDYIQRYFPSIHPREIDNLFLNTARAADKVLVTTDFTCQDAIQYAGVHPEKVAKLPMLAPKFSRRTSAREESQQDYFIWTTNDAIHKNHTNAFKAMQIYYLEMGGKLRCEMTGANTAIPIEHLQKHFAKALGKFTSNKNLKDKISRGGNLTNSQYQKLLQGSAFLWHPCAIDNGTFSVIEAASLGVPSLSSDYPAMREINEQFKLNLSWMDANDPEDMAQALKDMEENHITKRENLPSEDIFEKNSIENLAKTYWKAVRECL